MSNGIEKLSKVSTTNVCRRDGDVLLNTLEDELHTKVPLLLKTKLTVFIRLSALGAYLIFGPREWALIRGRRLFEVGRLLNFHHSQQVW